MYKHKVQYYETDKMGITHHSNYVRWMEEARVDALEKAGLPYDMLERRGVISPVVSVQCRYLHSSEFADVINIDVRLESFTGVRMKFRYDMSKEDGTKVCEAESEHCFLNEDGFPLRLKKNFPDIYEALIAMSEN